MKKIVIVGGGISGLSARYFLSKKYPDTEITLLEKSGRLGGCIDSEHQAFFFEKGPRTFKFSRSDALLKLIEELGLQSEILPSNKEAERRYLWRDQKMQTPFLLLLKILPSLLSEWRKPASSQKDETIEAFVKRRLGTYAAQTFFDPLTLGIYAGDIRKLSMRSCFPMLKALELQYGSLTKGILKSKKRQKQKGLFTLRGGVQSLVEKLIKQGRGPIHLNTPLSKIEENSHPLVLALPAQGMGTLLQGEPIAEAFFKHLELTSLTVVNLGYKESVLKKKGFGYLIPSSEGQEVLGVVFDSCIFPEQSQQIQETRLTVMLGGAFNPHLDPSECLAKAKAALKDQLEITAPPTFSHVTHYPDAIPQFGVGHQERMEVFKKEMQKRYPHVTCIGNYLQGVSVNDCIRLAQVSIDEIRNAFDPEKQRVQSLSIVND